MTFRHLVVLLILVGEGVMTLTYLVICLRVEGVTCPFTAWSAECHTYKRYTFLLFLTNTSAGNAKRSVWEWFVPSFAIE